MAESKLAVASMEFAVKILKLCDSIKGHYSIIKQLERSSTSIGANIREANYAYSRVCNFFLYRYFFANSEKIY